MGAPGLRVARCLEYLTRTDYSFYPLLLLSSITTYLFFTSQVTRGIYTSKVNHTGTYSAILSQDGEYHVAVGDMDIHKVITPDNVSCERVGN